MVQICQLLHHSIISVLFLSMFADISYMKPTIWTRNTYPNPFSEPVNCSRTSQSYVCDPDGILKKGQANQLDAIIARIGNDTLCICEDCDYTDPGITIGVALIKSIENITDIKYDEKAKHLAIYLRKKWNFGQCDDSVVILVSSDDNQSYTAVGSAVSSILTEEIVIKIFESSKNHFANGYYYQGLESILESYYDVLRKLQHSQQYSDNSSPSTFNTSLMVALIISVTILFLLLIFLSALLYRMKKTSQKAELGTNLTRWQASNPAKISIEDYKRCNVDDHNDDEDSTDDCLEDLDDNVYDMYQMNRIYGITKRQLSAVLEESEEEEEDKEGRTRSSSVDHKSSINGIPRIPHLQ